MTPVGNFPKIRSAYPRASKNKASFPMDLKQLRYFVQVTKLGSFNRAAEVLRIAQPALSRQVRLLEEELGVVLLQRNSRGVQPTPAGDLLVKEATQVLAKIDEIRVALRNASSKDLAGNVSVGMSAGIASLIGLPAVEAAREAFPGISVRIIEGFSSLLHEWLLSGSIDMALVYGVSQNPTLNSQPLVLEDLYVIAGATNPISNRDSIPAKELADMTLVLPHRPHARRDVLDHAGITSAKTIEVDVHRLLVHYTQENRGVSVMPLKSVEAELAQGTLKAIPITSPNLVQITSLCWTSDRPQTGQGIAIAAVIRTVIQDMVEQGRWPGSMIEQS